MPAASPDTGAMIDNGVMKIMDIVYDTVVLKAVALDSQTVPAKYANQEQMGKLGSSRLRRVLEDWALAGVWRVRGVAVVLNMPREMLSREIP